MKTSKLTLNEQGRWQTKTGRYFTCGDQIKVKYYDYDETLILQGKVEHGEQGYYFVCEDNVITIGLNENIEVILD